MSEGRFEYADFVRLVLDALDAATIQYLVGGAVAAWAWGEPRTTIDLDLVVDVPLDRIHQLSTELGKRGMLVPEEVILDDILEDRADIPICVIHACSGYKANLYPLRPGDELIKSAFLRRRLVDMGPLLGEIYIHSPENIILYKLWYYGLSQQTKHLRDITSIVLTMGRQIDYEYIRIWADRKGLDTLW